jgi:hypothetical protein
MASHRDAEAVGYACWEPGNRYGFCGCAYRHHAAPKPVLATFYMVRNDKGEYYRTYAQGGRRSGWVKELADGRLWTTKGPAQGKITALSNERPNAPVPELIEFVVHEVKVVDQKERVAKARLKRQEEKLKNEAYWKKVAVVEAEKELAEAQRKLEKLRRG